MNPAYTSPLARFQSWLALRPDATAVVVGDASLTWRELDDVSGRLAAHLRRRGVRPGDRVGLLVNKHLLTLAGILAAWKLGCPYVPVDVKAPLERVTLISDTCGIRHFLLDPSLQAKFLPLCQDRDFVLLGADDPALPGNGWSQALQESPIPGESGGSDALAYIIFTSGTTGVPKGVMISNASLSCFTQWCQDGLDLRPGQRALNIADFSFDQSVMDIAFLLASGVELHIFNTLLNPVVLADVIHKRRIEVMSTVPTAFGMLFDERFRIPAERLASVTRAFIGGAACPASYVKKFHAKFPGARLYNMYGPTEVTVYCLFHEFTADELEHGLSDVPLGVALPHHGISILDDAGREADKGELVVWGPQVMTGYWGRQDDVLVRDTDGRTGYRTGDLVRRGDDGRVYYVGRMNDTIKTSGFRVDLGEIDNLLSRDPRIINVAAVGVPDEVQENILHAFVVAHRENRPSADEIRALCKSRLPAYMVPQHVHFADSLPLNPSGKIDKKRLVASLTSTP